MFFSESFRLVRYGTIGAECTCHVWCMMRVTVCDIWRRLEIRETSEINCKLMYLSSELLISECTKKMYTTNARSRLTHSHEYIHVARRYGTYVVGKSCLKHFVKYFPDLIKQPNRKSTHLSLICFLASTIILWHQRSYFSRITKKREFSHYRELRISK